MKVINMKISLMTLFSKPKVQYWISFWGVLVLAAGLRFYQLGTVPHGMTWDEAAIGYNGYAIVTTRRDEWLQKLPISFKSFGDYKAPLAIYLNGPFTYLFGMTLWAVRLPFALIGVLAVAGIILVTTQLFEFFSIRSADNYFSAQNSGLIAGIIMSLSPWHLHYSRVGFESGIALALLIWAIYFLIRFLRSQLWQHQVLLITISGLLSVASLYAYHSSKIAVPLLIILFLVFAKKTVSYFKSLAIGGAVSLIFLWPLIADIWHGHALERGQTLVFYSASSLTEGITLVLNQFLTHFSPAFLVGGATPTLRLAEGSWGVLLATTLFLGGVAVGYFLKNLLFRQPNSKVFILSIIWIVIGILPAALGNDLVPHANRALLALPGFIWLAVLGLNQLLVTVQQTQLNQDLYGTHLEKNKLVQMVLGMLLLIHGLLFISYLHHYYTVFAADSATDFEDGYLETFNLIAPYEKGDQAHPAVDKIIFTDQYGQPYIYALFSRRTNPIWYQGGSLIKYEFRPIKPADLNRHNTLVVAGDKDEVPLESATHLIYGSDHQVKFSIFLLP